MGHARRASSASALTTLQLIRAPGRVLFVLALLAPLVVKRGRRQHDRSRRTNLKQLALATLHLPRCLNKSFPRRLRGERTRASRSGPPITSLLPYVEQVLPLFNKCPGKSVGEGDLGRCRPRLSSTRDGQQCSPTGDSYQGWLATTNYPRCNYSTSVFKDGTTTLVNITDVLPRIR